MTRLDRRPVGDALPEFDLAWNADDQDRPEEITVYDPTLDNLTTHWLTIDIAHAVPLEEVP